MLENYYLVNLKYYKYTLPIYYLQLTFMVSFIEQKFLMTIKSIIFLALWFCTFGFWVSPLFAP